jgi:predicted TIM-barrel fold metal-dependent hydrolase
MAFEHKAISVDSHAQEKPDTWTSRMSKARWGDRIPHIGDVADAANPGSVRDGWIMDGKPSPQALANCQAIMPNRMVAPRRWDEVPAMAFEPAERLKAMDRDGVTGSVLYPNTMQSYGDRFFGMEPAFEQDAVRAYNDYIAEEWMALAPDRLFGLAALPYSSMEATLAEVKRTAKLGFVGPTIISTPQYRGLPPYGDDYWEPFWSLLEDSQLTASFHSLGGKPAWMMLEYPKGHDVRHSAAALPASNESFQAQFFAQLLFTGTIERHPKLHFAIAESGVGWIPYMVEACDKAWEAGQLWKHGLKTRPSETFRRQCWADFWFEYDSLRYRDIIGEDRILWEDDFPHPTALYPNTREVTGRLLAGLPKETAHKFLVENAKECYRIS